MSNEDRIILAGGGCVIAVVIVVLSMALTMAVIAASGLYHYDYRCTDGVAEQHLNIGPVAFGGWDPIDGDPAGACQ